MDGVLIHTNHYLVSFKIQILAKVHFAELKAVFLDVVPVISGLQSLIREGCIEFEASFNDAASTGPPKTT